MTRVDCDREQDVLDALASRRWPARASDELREHVAGCAVCADLARVVAALLDERETAEPARDLPPASLVWWRAQLRAREEATRAALRPIRIVQAASLGCAIILLAWALTAVLPTATSSARVMLARSAAAIARIDRQAAADAALAPLANRGVQIAAGAWLVLAPVAAYLAFSRD